MVDYKSYARSVGSILFVAVLSFCGTMLLMACMGVVLAACTYYLLAEHAFWYGVIGAAVVLLETVIVGVLWAGKRAVVMALVHGLRRHRVGQVMVRLTFERLLGVTGEQDFGDRGGVVVRAVERLPLAQAEQRLAETVDSLLNADDGGRGVMTRLRRWLRRKLLRYVQAYTLARFRESGAQHGGVDVLMVKTELENRVDDLLVAKVRHGLNLWTLGVLIGLPAQVFAMVFVVLAFLK